MRVYSRNVDFGLRHPANIKKIEKYELSSDDDLKLQHINAIICETCIFKEQCYGMCIRNKEELEALRKDMLKADKSSNSDKE